MTQKTKNITTLSFYDMDGTLFSTPLPEYGKKIWKEKTGEVYPHQGWWGRSESLDLDVFDIEPFKNVHNKLKKDIKSDTTYTVLLTSRMLKLKPEIKKILHSHDIKFDELSLKHGGKGKDVRIKEILKNFKNVKTINVFDDREKELKIFKELKKEIGDQYEMNIYKADDGILELHESTNKLKKLVSEVISIYNKN